MHSVYLIEILDLDDVTDVQIESKNTLGNPPCEICARSGRWASLFCPRKSAILSISVASLVYQRKYMSLFYKSRYSTSLIFLWLTFNYTLRSRNTGTCLRASVVGGNSSTTYLDKD